MPSDPFDFDLLRRPYEARRPDIRFAVELRRRLEEELEMNSTDRPAAVATDASILPRMIHLGVPDADRAMTFFGTLFDWQSERVEWEGHIRHYMINTKGVQPVINDEAGAPPVRLGFSVPDANRAVELIRAGGGVIGRSELRDGGGFAMADDGQGIPLVVWRPDRDYPHEPKRDPKGEIDYIQIVVPAADRARALYTPLVGWELYQHEPGQYHHVNDRNGVLEVTFVESPDEAPSVRLFFTVDDVDAVAASVRRLGGSTGEHYRVGPGDAIDCVDDQGTKFAIVTWP